MTRILGIDPGSRVTGFGIIESDGVQSRYLASGCIRTLSDNFPQRLGEIFQGIEAVVKQYQPDEMAIEQVFVSKNPSSALKLGQARGAAICACVSHQLSVAEYTPRMVKQSVVGTGGAEKSQVSHMVSLLLKLKQVLAEDEADALAIAITHAHTSKLLKKIQRFAR